MRSLSAVEKECNKENMRTWVAGLRSGDYTQGTGYLAVQALGEDGEKTWTHCCLGVACELAVAAGVPMGVVESTKMTAPGELKYKKFSGQAAYLPLSVSMWLGISGSQADNPWVAVNLTAGKANDHNKWSYAQIANAVEEFYGLKEDSAPEVTDASAV